MISWFEKHNKLSWLITILIAVIIFYLSSLSFELGTPGPSWPQKSSFYHYIVFFFFSFFLLISLVQGKKQNLIFLGIIIAVLYGILDEIHQLFIPGRFFTIPDILTDSAGILSAAALYSLLILKKFKNSLQPKNLS